MSQDPHIDSAAPGGSGSGAAAADEGLEYRVERLRHQLTDGTLAELGLHVEVRGSAVAVSGAVASEECREQVLQVVADLMKGVTVHTDVVTTPVQAPNPAEEL